MFVKPSAGETEETGGAPGATPSRGRGAIWLVPAIDYGPLVVFLIVYFLSGLLAATAATMAVTALAFAGSLLLTRRVPIMALFSGAMLLLLGGLTLWLDDDRYLKLQSTLTSAILSIGLFAAFIMQWPILRGLCGNAIALEDAGWRLLTLRLAIFFGFMAALNELIVRTQSNDFWAQYYSYGSSVLTIAFLLAQWRLIERHLVPAKEAAEPASAESDPGD